MANWFRDSGKRLDQFSDDELLTYLKDSAEVGDMCDGNPDGQQVINRLVQIINRQRGEQKA